ncbi:MAG: three-Cys-motif partner protein TcmP [Chloroflexi bacterium]|nr:three-Cys-motif partner protein TcmP [Chloroflexota bacterium]
MAKVNKKNFGGPWTVEKLDCIEKFLKAYSNIFKLGSKGARFETSYVDGFVGSGESKACTSIDSDADQLFCMQAQLYESSAKRALDLVHPFDKYYFIDIDNSKLQKLNKIKQEYPHLSSKLFLFSQDANEFMIDFCDSFNNSYERAVVFLDPYAMQVKWKTVEIIGRTKGIDLWWLAPIGVAPLRLLKRNRLPESIYSGKLDEMFGTQTWKDRFYTTDEPLALFEQRPRTVRSADWKIVVSFLVERLKTTFNCVLEDPLVLMNRNNNPMYALCYASQNMTGLRIAKDIVSKKKRESTYVS